MKYKIILSLILFVGLFITTSNAITDEEIEQSVTWRIDIKLDMPDLEPHAVQYAIFDTDPIPGFMKRVLMVRDFYHQKMDEAKDEDERQMWIHSGMRVAWDNGFEVVTGDLVYLLIGDAGYASTGPVGKKWIATKVVHIGGKPTCWLIPIEVKVGDDIDVVLNRDNTFDLVGLFEEAMAQEPQQEK